VHCDLLAVRAQRRYRQGGKEQTPNKAGARGQLTFKFHILFNKSLK
jgi:hypothetical protein